MCCVNCFFLVCLKKRSPSSLIWIRVYTLLLPTFLQRILWGGDISFVCAVAILPSDYEHRVHITARPQKKVMWKKRTKIRTHYNTTNSKDKRFRMREMSEYLQLWYCLHNFCATLGEKSTIALKVDWEEGKRRSFIIFNWQIHV